MTHGWVEGEGAMDGAKKDFSITFYPVTQEGLTNPEPANGRG
jgi:hypothetical protein